MVWETTRQINKDKEEAQRQKANMTTTTKVVKKPKKIDFSHREEDLCQVDQSRTDQDDQGLGDSSFSLFVHHTSSPSLPWISLQKVASKAPVETESRDSDRHRQKKKAGMNPAEEEVFAAAGANHQRQMQAEAADLFQPFYFSCNPLLPLIPPPP